MFWRPFEGLNGLKVEGLLHILLFTRFNSNKITNKFEFGKVYFFD